ncbi:MAG TPA: VWA domain-containing protein [Polyangiaceae bacterium]|nr:VWA domain-containing protein [Polyangiaceae bacterium]
MSHTHLLALLAVVPILLWALFRSLADLPWQQRVLAGLARLGFLVCLALGVAGLSRQSRSQQVCAVFLVDVSDSASDQALEFARTQVTQALQASPDPEGVKLIAFAKRPRLIDLRPGEPASALVPTVAEFRAQHAAGEVGAPHPEQTKETDIQAAIQLAEGIFPADHLRRIVLLSDGLQTLGDATSEVGHARELGVELWTAPYRFAPPAEVAVTALRVPDKIEIGTPFKIIAEIHASVAASARARLYQGELLNGLQGVQSISLKPGSNEISFDSVVRLGGDVTYKLQLDQLSADHFPQNNSYSVTVEVPGRPAVLYIDSQPEQAGYLTRALQAQQFDVELRSPTGLPSTLAELEHYALIILSDVPASAISPSGQELIERYVRDLGGGLVFAGGTSGFELGGWMGTSLSRILPVRMDPERQKDMPGVAMSLVIDRSGSMTGLPLDMAKAACSATVGTLQGDDLVEVIAFDSQATRYVKMQPARYRGRIQSQIAQIQPGGGTAIFPALDAAYQDISVVQARKKHVILLTDGRAENQGIRDLVSAMVAENITVTTVGMGDGVDAELLRMIADTGGGRYHAVADPNSLPRIFTRETEMISQKAQLTDWFPVTQTSQADFLRGISIATAPLLHGFVTTAMKEPPAQQILASETGEPILARLRVGLGQVVAWTSDVKSNWAVDWLKWPSFGQFWGQLVREHMRQKQRRELHMNSEIVADRLHVYIDAFTVDQQFDNDLQGRFAVTGQSGSSREEALQQTAPGRYELWLPMSDYGAFKLRADFTRHTDEGSNQAAAISFGHISHPYSQEYANLEPDLAMMERLTEAGGGKQDAPAAQLFDPGGQFILHREPLWQKLILLALGLFVLDLLMRRVRLFDRKFVVGTAKQ